MTYTPGWHLISDNDLPPLRANDSDAFPRSESLLVHDGYGGLFLAYLEVKDEEAPPAWKIEGRDAYRLDMPLRWAYPAVSLTPVLGPLNLPAPSPAPPTPQFLAAGDDLYQIAPNGDCYCLPTHGWEKLPPLPSTDSPTDS